jgi:hypothetical protein
LAAGAGVPGIAAVPSPPIDDFVFGFWSGEVVFGESGAEDTLASGEADVFTAENGDDADENAENDCAVVISVS